MFRARDSVAGVRVWDLPEPEIEYAARLRRPPFGHRWRIWRTEYEVPFVCANRPAC